MKIIIMIINIRGKQRENKKRDYGYGMKESKIQKEKLFFNYSFSLFLWSFLSIYIIYSSFLPLTVCTYLKVFVQNSGYTCRFPRIRGFFSFYFIIINSPALILSEVCSFLFICFGLVALLFCIFPVSFSVVLNVNC